MKQGGKEADGATRVAQMLSGISVALDRLVAGEAVRDTARALDGLREQQVAAVEQARSAQRELAGRVDGLVKDWQEQQLGAVKQARSAQQELLAQTLAGLRDTLSRIGDAVAREPALTLPSPPRSTNRPAPTAKPSCRWSLPCTTR